VTARLGLSNNRSFPVPGCGRLPGLASRTHHNARGGGYFTLIFVVDPSGAGESNRLEWQFTTATVSVGTVTTAADGLYSMPLPALPRDAFLIELSHGGTLPAMGANWTNELWPALATVVSGTQCAGGPNLPPAYAVAIRSPIHTAAPKQVMARPLERISIEPLRSIRTPPDACDTLRSGRRHVRRMCAADAPAPRSWMVA